MVIFNINVEQLVELAELQKIQKNMKCIECRHAKGSVDKLVDKKGIKKNPQIKNCLTSTCFHTLFHHFELILF